MSTAGTGPTGLHPDEATDLAAVLSILEDWLLHTDDMVLDDLASFAFRGSANRSHAVQIVIDELGSYSLRMRALGKEGPQ